jgi:hypothetical protein
VFADGYAPMHRSHDVFEGVNKGWDFTLPQSARVSGKVLDTKGNPMPHRFLQLASLRDRRPPPRTGHRLLYPMPSGCRNDRCGWPL